MFHIDYNIVYKSECDCAGDPNVNNETQAHTFYKCVTFTFLMSHDMHVGGPTARR